MRTAKETENLKKNIIEVINNSPLSITLKKYIVADIFRELEMEYIKLLSAKEGDTDNE